MAHCLVVGGGFIGAHCADRLVAADHRVTVFSRSFNDWLTRPDAPEGIETVEGTIGADGALRELVAEADVVVYVAGSSTPAASEADPGGSIERAVVPATAVLEHVRATGGGRVVMASSGGGVYGEVREVPTRETHPTVPINVHGLNALTIERYADFYATHYGVEPVILRYSNPYGPAQPIRHGQGVIAAWCNAVARDEPVVVFGDTSISRDFVYVADAADATARAAFEANPGIYNVGAGRSTPLTEVLATIAQVSGRAPRLDERQGRPVDVRVTQLDSSRLEAQVGWRASTSLPDGIAAQWSWAESHV
ncbi:MAG: UDP-glucose 4-epimerase [Thermoleophilaceae bacterium]|nr:UDP-glucose 4-epimerase [Thermoleophilaceae bacterium]